MIQQKSKWTQSTNLAVKYRLSLLGLSIIVILLDQFTKQVARANLVFQHIKTFIKFWDWTLIYNEGAAFNFLADQGGWQKVLFISISFLVSVVLIYYILRKSYSVVTGIAFSYILGGAIGNTIDRVIDGKVTDFIYWHIGAHYWPAFNVADAFVCIGVTLLIIESLFFGKNTRK